jgi:uncharacterized protein (UPF0264 family)
VVIRILISAQNIQEVESILKEPPDIIDLKNPHEGSLGAPNISLVKKVHKKIEPVSQNIEYSVAIGDFPYLPGTASMAAFGLSHIPINYLKIGLLGPSNLDEAIHLSSEVVSSVRLVNPKIKVVLVGYADHRKINQSVDPLTIPEIAYKSNADVAMVDTKIKDGTSLFSHLTLVQIHKFVSLCKDMNLKSALAGSLQFTDLENIKKIKPDIIGVRSMVCEKFDRMHGSIQTHLIRKLKRVLT